MSFDSTAKEDETANEVVAIEMVDTKGLKMSKGDSTGDAQSYRDFQPLNTDHEHQEIFRMELRPSLISRLRERLRVFGIKYFLPLGFALALGIAIAWPTPGSKLSSIKTGGFGVVQTLCVCVIFLVSGLCFKTSDIKGALDAVRGWIFGILSILILSPSTGFGIMKLGFIPYHYRVGLSIFLCSPTTLTIGVALVEQAGGNTALALFLTIFSNIFGILTVPFAVKLVLRSHSDAAIDAVQLLLKLLFSILLPLIIGKSLLEASTAVQDSVSKRRLALSLIKNSACVVIVWLSLSESRKELLEQKTSQIFSLLLLCGLVHIFLLVFNYLASSLLRLPDREKMSVVIMASQKTFPVTLAVISYLDPNKVGERGLLAIPCILAHMTQLFIDSFLLSKWKYETEM